MITVENLVKKFGLRTAVDDISFQVEKGGVLGFLGPNGAGKTTTIRMLAGYLPPTSGKIDINGIDVVADPVRAQKQMGYMPEHTPLYDEMTVRDFLRFLAEVRGFSGKERNQRVDGILEACMLRGVQHQIIDTLSKGYRRRTSLAQALLHDPEVLLLDEPTEGLDPNQKQVVRDMIVSMAQDKIILLSTHVLEEVDALCSRIMVISEGRLKADGRPADLKKRSRDYNVLTVELLAPAAEATAAFQAIPDVAEVQTVAVEGPKSTLRLIPRDKQALAVHAIEVAAHNKWMVTEIRAEPGRLDDVFRQITTTADVVKQTA
ncbi:MAG TPA: ABC transporter ATP-binding protein [Kiritimatiellia bacterium]|jgi:ABC-2 type transport system ATP-binding protein|nr:ABC transporter ATP-binding protein [Lentisphaerota bacterium]HRV30331.1 ABC transporter ATP-binding protein [Kiritimatiellia bacterium]